MKPKDQENDRQFWLVVVVVSIVLYGGLTVFHRYTQLGRSLSVDGLAMIGTTLVAAAIGFLAILLQVRSSSKQLRDQIREQRDAERTEQERQKKAVASALLLEIDNFYLRHLIDREIGAKVWRQLDANRQTVEVLKLIIGAPFVIFEASADRLRELDESTSRAVIASYGAS